MLSTAMSNLLVCCLVKHRLMRSSSLKSQLLEITGRRSHLSFRVISILCSLFSSLRKRYLCHPQEVITTRDWPSVFPPPQDPVGFSLKN